MKNMKKGRLTCIKTTLPVQTKHTELTTQTRPGRFQPTSRRHFVIVVDLSITMAALAEVVKAAVAAAKAADMAQGGSGGKAAGKPGPNGAPNAENPNLFTLDYLFHNYKFIKRKLSAVEMRKIAQRRMAEKLKEEGYSTKGVLDRIIEEDVTIENPVTFTPRGITLMLTSEKTTLVGLTEGQSLKPDTAGYDDSASNTKTTMAVRHDLEGGAEDDSNSTCELCGEVAIFNGYACRICPRRFHAECMLQRELINDNEAYLMTMIGPVGLWSCHECCNLESFLRENELAVVRRKFNKIDKDGDGTLTLEEYLKHKSIIFGKVGGHASMEDDMNALIKQFITADLDRDGELSWVEFVTSEARRYLVARDPEKDLVCKITPKELTRARAQFDSELEQLYGKEFVAWSSSNKYNKEEQWKTWLKDHAISIILARANQWPEKEA